MMQLFQLAARPKERQRVWRQHKQTIIRVGAVCAALILLAALVAWSSGGGGGGGTSGRHADDDALPLHAAAAPARSAALASGQEKDQDKSALDVQDEPDALTRARRAARLRKKQLQSAGNSTMIDIQANASKVEAALESPHSEQSRVNDTKLSPAAVPPSPSIDSDAVFIPPLSKEEQSLLEEAAERGTPEPVLVNPTPVSTSDEAPTMDAVAEVVAPVQSNTPPSQPAPAAAGLGAQVDVDHPTQSIETPVLKEAVQATPEATLATPSGVAVQSPTRPKRKDEGMTFTRTRSWRKEERSSAAEPSPAPVAATQSQAESADANKQVGSLSMEAAASPSEVRNLTLVWDFGACGCTGWSMEATNMVLGLAPYVAQLAIVAGENCFCPGIPEADLQLLEELRTQPVHEWEIDIWISHKPPQRYPSFPYRGVVRVTREPLFIIGRSMSEVHRVPASWAERIASAVDEVWLPSAHSVLPFTRAGVDAAKLVLIPEPVDETLYDPAHTEALDLANMSTDEFNFLSVFKLEPRKGWKELVRAFFEEFSADEPVTLTLHTYLFAEANPFSTRRIRSRIDQFVDTLAFPDRNLTARPLPHDNLRVLSGQLSLERMPRLYRAFDAFVLPTHGEGWGLPLMEAMAMGLPAIATNWGGQLAFMNASNSFLLPLERFAKAEGNDFERGALWAVPDLAALRRSMRFLASHPDVARAVGARARVDVVTNFNRASVAAHMLDRLDVLQPVILARRAQKAEGRQITRGAHLTHAVVHDPTRNVGMRARRGDASAEAEAQSAVQAADLTWLDQVIAESKQTGWQGPKDPQHAYAFALPPQEDVEKQSTESAHETRSSSESLDARISSQQPAQLESPPQKTPDLPTAIQETELSASSSSEQPAASEPLAARIAPGNASPPPDSEDPLAGGPLTPYAPALALPLDGGIVIADEPVVPLSLANAEQPALSLVGGIEPPVEPLAGEITTADDPQPLAASIESSEPQQRNQVSSPDSKSDRVASQVLQRSVVPSRAASAHIPSQMSDSPALAAAPTPRSAYTPSLYDGLDAASTEGEVFLPPAASELRPRRITPPTPVHPLAATLAKAPTAADTPTDEAEIIFDHGAPSPSARLPVIKADPAHVEGRFVKRAAIQASAPRTTQAATRHNGRSKARAVKPAPTRVEEAAEEEPMDEDEDQSASYRRPSRHAAKKATRRQPTKQQQKKKKKKMVHKKKKVRTASEDEDDAEDEPRTRPHQQPWQHRSHKTQVASRHQSKRRRSSSRDDVE